MDSSVKVSVIMAVYNNGEYLKEAIDSILNQTFSEFEFLVVDDGSTDTTPAVLSQYRDARIKIIRNETNKGLIYSLNLLLTLSHGVYLARMDSDDIALPDRLKVQYDFMEKNAAVGVCGSFVEAFYPNNPKKQIIRYPEDDWGIRAFTFFQSPFCHPVTMIRREILEKYNLQYSYQFFKGEDYGLWVELLKYAQGATIPQVLLRFRKHDDSASNWGYGKTNEKIQMLASIRQNYLSYNKIVLDTKDLYLYTQFTDRSIPCDLDFHNQKRISGIIKIFLNQLSGTPKKLETAAIHYLATICFYKFFIKKRIPFSFSLQKLFIYGALIYVKRIFLNQFE
jgi:glycosyltransferase involved in cell wall biosynthesis